MWPNERELQFLEYYHMKSLVLHVKNPILLDSKHVKHKDMQGAHDAGT